MIIRSYYRLIGPGVRVPFAAFDGVEPYTFSVKAGGIGGTVTQNGFYTAPIDKTGTDTIVAEDADGEKAEYKIGVGIGLHFIADIISKELALDPSQVIIQNQKFKIPNDSKLYVAIKGLTMRAIANRNHFDDGVEGQSVNMFGPVDVAIYSRSTEALTRKEEVVMAMNSNYAKNQQQLNGFLIGKIGNIVSLSEIDGAAIPYFFNVNLNIQYAVTKQRPVDYFDSFELDDVITNP